MARPKETPVPVPGQGKHVSTKSQLSQERISVSSSTSSSDSESSSDSYSDSDESDRSDSSSLRDSPDTSTRRQATTAVLPQSRPVYEPPQGFQPLKTDPSTSTISQLLSPPNLAGKQIWYITAPASVPVSNLKEVSTQKVMNGEVVLSHKGSEYGFVSLDEATASSSQAVLLVPGKEGYQLAGTNFSRTILLQQLVRLPLRINTLENTEGVPQAPPALPAARKAVRKQPEGLKMRFTPIGFDSSGSTGIGWSSSPDDSDTDGAEVSGKGTSANSFRYPNGFTESHHPEKRKRESLNGGIGDTITIDTELSPRKKRQKHKTDHKLHSSANAPSTPQNSDTRHQTKNPHSSQSTPQFPSTIPTHDSSGRRRETSQERARRKEKERRRREKAEKSQDNDRPRHSHRRHKEKPLSAME